MVLKWTTGNSKSPAWANDPKGTLKVHYSSEKTIPVFFQNVEGPVAISPDDNPTLWSLEIENIHYYVIGDLAKCHD